MAFCPLYRSSSLGLQVVYMYLSECFIFEQEYWYADCKNGEETIALGQKSEDCCVSDHASVNNNLRRGNYIATNLAVSNTLIKNVLKFMVLFGLLTFQGSQPAVALSDIASGLQSIPYVGDLGDISTGFASVRKISLNFYI